MPMPELSVNGSWDEILARLYGEFCAVFKCIPRREFMGKPIVFDQRMSEGYEEGFWHLITGEDPTAGRVFEASRARRLSWIGPILDGSAAGLSRWTYLEGNGTTKIYLWLEADGYVVILAERRRATSLVTAFTVDRPWKEQDLRRKRSQGVVF